MFDPARVKRASAATTLLQMSVSGSRDSANVDREAFAGFSDLRVKARSREATDVLVWLCTLCRQCVVDNNREGVLYYAK